MLAVVLFCSVLLQSYLCSHVDCLYWRLQCVFAVCCAHILTVNVGGCSALQCVAVCCSVLQCVAVCCSANISTGL